MLRIRGSAGWILPVAGSGDAMIGLLGQKEIDDNLSAESARTPPPPPPPWDLKTRKSDTQREV